MAAKQQTKQQAPQKAMQQKQPAESGTDNDPEASGQDPTSSDDSSDDEQNQGDGGDNGDKPKPSAKPKPRASDAPPKRGDEVLVRLFMSGGAYRNIRGTVTKVTKSKERGLLLDVEVDIPGIGQTSQTSLERVTADGKLQGWCPTRS